MVENKLQTALKALAISSFTALTLIGTLIIMGVPNSIIYQEASGETSERISESSITDVALVKKFLEEAGAEDPTVIVTDDERNCALWEDRLFGGKKKKSANPETGQKTQGGCWRSSTPETIYISSGISNQDSLRFVTLHEYAHVLQHKEEWPIEADGVEPDSMARDCLADVWAYKNGAEESHLSYFNQGVCEPYRNLLTEE